MTSYLDPTIQAGMEMMRIVEQLKDLTTQGKPQFPKPMLSFLATLPTDLLPQLLRYDFCHSHLTNEAQAAELLYLVMQYVEKPETEPRTERYGIDIAKATKNGKCAQVTFELPGGEICLVRVAKVYTTGSELAQIQYRVISSAETGIVGDIDEFSAGRIEENGKGDADNDHFSDDPARAVEKSLEENLKIYDALIDGSAEKFLQANCGSKIGTRPVWEDLRVLLDPVLAPEISDNA